MTTRQAVWRLAEPCMFDLIHQLILIPRGTLCISLLLFSFTSSFQLLGLHILHTLCTPHMIWNQMATLGSQSPILSYCVGVRHGHLS